jgi:3-oxoacyl-[acyl-carrier protein] reductase
VKNILISGGSRGLGFDLAGFFAAKGEYQVVTFARGEARSQHGVRHLSGIDVANEQHLESLVAELEAADVLVNNVGMAYDGILATQGSNSIREMLDVNLFSVLYLTKLYIRQRLGVRKKGVVVTISSIISERGFSGLSTYAATKAALNSMTRSLAREMGPKGFRFNAVLPGYFESDLSKDLSDEKRGQIVRRTPMGRLATTADICPLVEFLATDASQFITGQSVIVDGGLTV